MYGGLPHQTKLVWVVNVWPHVNVGVQTTASLTWWSASRPWEWEQSCGGGRTSGCDSQVGYTMERTEKKKAKHLRCSWHDRTLRHASVHLGGRGIFSVLQRQRHGAGARLAPESHPGTQRPDVADSDHCSLHANQPPEHTGAQRAQRRQGLVVVQPADNRHLCSSPPAVQHSSFAARFTSH